MVARSQADTLSQIIASHLQDMVKWIEIVARPGDVGFLTDNGKVFIKSVMSALKESKPNPAGHTIVAVDNAGLIYRISVEKIGIIDLFSEDAEKELYMK